MTTTFPRTMGYGLGSSLQRGASAFGPWVDPYDYPQRDQTMTTAPSYPPFKFESRRSRIDWRLLHGVDINAMMRDVDLDTLEKIVNIVAFGDIEAEDTRHLTELNFIKIFRLSQMMIEYLLYVQDCLQSSNGWLQQDRGNMDKYIQAARLRIRELEANLKMNKRELRRTRKTIKTYELLAVLNDGKATHAATLPAAFTTAAAPASPAPPPPQPQVARVEPNPVNLAMEALLRKELAGLGERLSRATLECQTLRSERDEVYQAVKDLEATVKGRSREQLSGASSPPTYSRQNAEAMQMIQGLQDQLNKATVEIAKLRNDQGDMSEELERANAERRQLQDEKSRLLSELAVRPAESPRGVSESPRASDNLGSMLLEADRQKAALQDQLSDAKAEITALQRQLMKAMKATALGDLPPSQAPPDDRLVRELESTKVQLERELADMRRTYNEDVQQLQEELELAQEKAVEADRRLMEMRAVQRDGAGRMSPPQSAGGFVKIVEERRDGPEEPDHGADRQRALLAEYETTNERLNQQLLQLKGERNALAGEVEQLRLQLQNRTSPPPGDRSIGRDWRTEEIDRLKDERDTAQRRILDLEDAVRDRDAMVERLRAVIRDLQAQLDESYRQQESAETEPSRVKQQVKQFERLADPTKPPKVQASFSFNGDSPPGSGAVVVETPTSVRKPVVSERPPLPPKSPPRSASPSAATPSIPEEPERGSAALLSPSPRQAQVPPQESRWLGRTQWPTQTEALAIQQKIMRRVDGQSLEDREKKITNDIRVITEAPYPYEDDEEERFRALMPYEIEERNGVRSVMPHPLEDLATARSLYTDQLLAVVHDQMAQYGLDQTVSSLDDKVYLACMEELADRRSEVLRRLPKEVKKRAEDLREFLLTHLELIKRGDEARRLEERRLQVQQEVMQKLQPSQQHQQQQVRSSAAGGDGPLDEDEDDELGADASTPAAAAVLSAATGASGSGAAQQVPPRVSREEPARPAAAMPSKGLAAPAEAAAKPLATTSAAAAEAAAAAPAQRQLPAFPSRQPSLQRSSAAGEEASTQELRNTQPPAPGSSRPASETTQKLALSQRSTPGQGRGGGGGGGGLTHLSREASAKEELRSSDASSRDDPSGVTQLQPMRPSSSSSGGSGSGVGLRQQSARSGQSLPRSGTTSTTGARPAAAGGWSSGGPQTATPVILKREVAPSSPERVTLGHARPTPTPVARAGLGGAVTTTAGGNMNMSIRSGKYQESDFDDEEDDVMPLPQPKPVRRLVEDDEYALTEDEEAQQDMGIEDNDDFSAGAPMPKILMAPTGGSPSRPAAPVPSRLGVQPTPATTQSRGWATEEPLQPAPAKTRASRPPSESAEMELLESIHSFDNPNSQSLKRSPGAWGSPSGTMRKPQPRGGGEPSTQMSVASKQSGWNEAITSFGVASGTGDDVQDMTESFTDNIRPMGRMMGQRTPAGASQAPAPPQPRTIARRVSSDDDLSEIEYA